MKALPRIFLIFSSILLVFTASVHFSGYHKVFSDPAVLNLVPYQSNGFRALWLADSAVQLIAALIFGFIAYKFLPSFKPIVLMLAMIPATNAALLYYFLGDFIGAHFLLSATIISITAGLLFPSGKDSAN